MLCESLLLTFHERLQYSYTVQNNVEHKKYESSFCNEKFPQLPALRLRFISKWKPYKRAFCGFQNPVQTK